METSEKKVVAKLAWGAAAAAYRHNGQKFYTKEMVACGDTIAPVRRETCAVNNGTLRRPNYSLMRSFITEAKFIPEPTEHITAEDYELGNTIREHYRMLLFAFIAGDLQGFLKDAHVASIEEEIGWDSTGIPLVAALPDSYFREIKRADEREKLAKATEDSTIYGAVNSQFVGPVEVLDVHYKKRYRSYAVNVINDSRQVFFFFTTDNYIVGERLELSGFVKAHHSNTTQLERTQRRDGKSNHSYVRNW